MWLFYLNVNKFEMKSKRTLIDYNQRNSHGNRLGLLLNSDVGSEY